MPTVPFYLQRPVEESRKYTLPNAQWDTYENPGVYNSSYGVGQFSFDRANRNAALAEMFAKNMEHIANAQPAPPTERPFSWKDNINYENGYNSDIEGKFRAEHDYLGLADYLSHFRMGNLQEQRAYENEIAQIRRYGREYNAIHRFATNDQSDAINFLEAFNHGSIDTLDSNNTAKKNYDNVISVLGRREHYTSGYMGNAPENYITALNPTSGYARTEYGEDEAATIRVSFNNKHVSYGLWGFGYDWMAKDKNEHQFNKFVEDTGYGLQDIESILGDKAINYENGRMIISIPKSNQAGITLLTKIRKWCNDTGRTDDDVQYASYGSDNKLINGETSIIGKQIQGLSDFLDRTNAYKDEVMNNITEKNIVSTISLPYMNEGQMQLKQLSDAGMIDIKYYNARVKADNDIYRNLLLATDFSQLDIYTTDGNKDPGDRTLRRMENNLDRGALKDYINNAISEDRVSWRAAISGGEYGTYLEINAVDDKGKLITDKDDSRRGMTIFIPGLFTESVQQAFNASTQGKTVAEFNSMQLYGYERTLQNGNILSKIGNETAELYDKDTRSSRVITREEAQDMLHQDIIIEDAARNIRNRAFNLDGTPRVGYDIKQNARKIAIAAANELYPQGGGIEENDVAVWNNSSEDIAKRNALGNVDKDYAATRAYNIYTQIMNNIYQLLNVKR